MGGGNGFYTNPGTEQVISGRHSEALPSSPFKREHIAQLQGVSLADSLQVLIPSSSPQLYSLGQPQPATESALVQEPGRVYTAWKSSRAILALEPPVGLAGTLLDLY